MKLQPNQKFFAELVVQSDGRVKIKKAQQYRIINQYVRGWMPLESREFARSLKNSELVTR